MASLNQSPIRVLLAEENGIFRESFSAGLRAGQRIVLASVSPVTGPAAVAAAIAASKPDVAVIGLQGAGTVLREWVTTIRNRFPRLRLVLLADPQAQLFVTLAPLLRGDGLGYAVLLRQDINSADDLVHTVHAIADGRVVIDPLLLESLLTPQPASGGLRNFSARETDVLRLMAAGYHNKAIASALYITNKTVERHIQSIYSKLGRPPEALQPRAYAIAAFHALGPAAPLPA